MSYEAAVTRAWDELAALTPAAGGAVRFLADEYSVDLASRRVMSLSCNVPAKDFAAILILHYCIVRLKGLPAVTGEWLDFKELSGIEGYAPAFRRRTIDIILRKYGTHPEGILEALNRFPSVKADKGDVGIVVRPFEGVPVLIALWRPDQEFGPEANVLFDRSIARIFCTEDIVVLAQLVAVGL